MLLTLSLWLVVAACFMVGWRWAWITALGSAVAWLMGFSLAFFTTCLTGAGGFGTCNVTRSLFDQMAYVGGQAMLLVVEGSLILGVTLGLFKDLAGG
jgi:hypothetical protein